MYYLFNRYINCLSKTYYQNKNKFNNTTLYSVAGFEICNKAPDESLNEDEGIRICCRWLFREPRCESFGQQPRHHFAVPLEKMWEDTELTKQYWKQKKWEDENSKLYIDCDNDSIKSYKSEEHFDEVEAHISGYKTVERCLKPGWEEIKDLNVGNPKFQEYNDNKLQPILYKLDTMRQLRSSTQKHLSYKSESYVVGQMVAKEEYEDLLQTKKGDLFLMHYHPVTEQIRAENKLKRKNPFENTSNSKEADKASKDTPEPWGLFFQDNATPQMEALEELHNNIMFYLAIIMFSVTWIFLSIILNYAKSNISNKYINHGTLVELIWTITPALILILIAFPSFKLLYLMDEVIDPSLVIYGEGHQWYWSYQYPDFTNNSEEYVEYDSYIIPESDLEIGKLRMLEVDNRVIIPELTHTRFIVAGADVIHSYACPSLGIKCDAYPGRLNQSSVYLNREGSYFGQCSEICGILHSSMPISIQSVGLAKFLFWLYDQIGS